MELNSIIEHTILKPAATRAEVETLCGEAVKYQFASVCVNSCHVPLVRCLLAGSGVKTCCAVGFPLGAMATAPKAYEAAWGVEAGAEEVDMVLNIGALREGDTDFVREDIRQVAAACHPRAILKVIIECCLLTDEEKALACRLAVEAGADFVKTSTGFSTGGATPGDVALMRKTVGDGVGVKASGGIRTREDALAMVGAGADRLGTSAGIKIVEG